MNHQQKDPCELQLFDVVQAELGANHPANKPFHVPPRERIELQGQQEPEEKLKFESREPSMIDFLTAPFFKRPPRDWEQNADFVAEFFGTTAMALTQLDAIVDISNVRDYHRDEGHGGLRLDRDVPQLRPIAPCSLWQWSEGKSPRHSGVIVNGGNAPVLSGALNAFEKAMNAGGDIDAWLIHRSIAQFVEAHQEQSGGTRTTQRIAHEALSAPATFHVGRAFETQIQQASGSGKDARAAELQVQPLGLYAITLDASGRPYPHSLVMLPYQAPDAKNDERNATRLARACLVVALGHTFVRAPETSLVPVLPTPYGGQLEPLYGRALQPFSRLDLGDLPRVLDEEAFAKKDGLAAALKMLARKWEVKPMEAKAG